MAGRRRPATIAGRSSPPRRAEGQRAGDARLYLAEAELTAGEIAARFQMSKPAVSQHLSVLENAGLVESDRRGQFVHYRLVREHLANTLNGYLQEVCPVSKPLKRERAALARRGGTAD